MPVARYAAAVFVAAHSNRRRRYRWPAVLGLLLLAVAADVGWGSSSVAVQWGAATAAAVIYLGAAIVVMGGAG